MTAQDVLVTVMAVGAVVMIGRRWWTSRASTSGACANCPSSEPRRASGTEASASAEGAPEVKPLAFFGGSARRR